MNNAVGRTFVMTMGLSLVGIVAGSAANFSVNIGLRSMSIDANGVQFTSAATVDNVPLSINDNETVVVPQLQAYSFTDISNFGNQTFTGASSRGMRVNGVEQEASYSVSVSLQPGSISFGQTATMSWDLDFSGDRKTISGYIGATGGGGSHSGFFAGHYSLAEVFDNPLAFIDAIPAEVELGTGLTLGGLSSFDLDSTGAIVTWDWDLDYDGSNFATDLSGAETSPDAALMQATYVDGGTYTVGLRVTDDTGATNITSASFLYSSVPEPSALLLLSLGGMGWALRRRR